MPDFPGEVNPLSTTAEQPHLFIPKRRSGARKDGSSGWPWLPCWDCPDPPEPAFAPRPCSCLESCRTLPHSSPSPAADASWSSSGLCPDRPYPVSERAVFRRRAGAAAAALHGHAGDGADPEVRLQRQVHVPGRRPPHGCRDAAGGRPPPSLESAALEHESRGSPHTRVSPPQHCWHLYQIILCR